MAIPPRDVLPMTDAALLLLLRELAEEQRQCREYLGRLVALAEERQAADRALAQMIAGPGDAEPELTMFEDYQEVPNGGYLVLTGGAWMRATPAQAETVRELIQSRKRR
jgi:hypothetical protein